MFFFCAAVADRGISPQQGNTIAHSATRDISHVIRRSQLRLVLVIGAGVHGLSTACISRRPVRTYSSSTGRRGIRRVGFACGVVRNNYFQPR